MPDFPNVLDHPASGYGLWESPSHVLDFATIDPLLAEAVLFTRAGYSSGSNEGTAGSALDAGGTFASVGPWTGSALVGLMTRDAAYDDAGSWFTDLDISATFSIPAHHANGAGQWAEVFHIPVTGGGGATEWAEFAVIFRDNGDLWIGFDFDSASETSVNEPTWVSGQVYADDSAQPLGVIGNWHAGVAEATWRLTIVAATGAVTLRKDGVTVVTDTMGAVAFPEPPDGEAIQVGPFQYALVIKSVSLKASIGGAEILGWSAASPTGWTLGTGSAAVGAAPADPFFFAGDQSATGKVIIPDNAALNVAVDADATFAFWFNTPHAANVDGEFYTYAARATGNLGANGNGFNLVDGLIAAFSVDFSGSLLGDGTDQAGDPNSGDHWTAGAHLAVLQINRTTDVATLYVDGVSHATAAIAAVGALNPAADLILSAAAHHAVAKWDRLLTSDERARLLGYWS